MAGPRPVVLSGPSGAGKSTLLKKLMKEYNNVFGFSVSRKRATSTPLITIESECSFIYKEIFKSPDKKKSYSTNYDMNVLIIHRYNKKSSTWRREWQR